MPTTKKKPTVEKTTVAKKKPVKKVETDKEVVLEAQEVAAASAAKGGSFIPAIGRRKTSIARVRLIKNGKGVITVNGKSFDKYFSTDDYREQVTSPLKVAGQETAVDISVRVSGGGVRGQAQAVRLGISRALIELNPTFRTALKKMGFLTRDPRKRERKKYGHTGARRSPQWSKR